MKKLLKESVLEKRQAYWKNILSDYKQSGLHQEKFCLQKELSLHRFKYWYYKFKDKEPSDSLDKKEILLPSMNFVEVKLTENNTENIYLEVEVDNRFKIKLMPDFNEAILLRFVKAVS